MYIFRIGAEFIIWFLVGILILLILFKFFSWPLKQFGKLIVNGIMGAVLLYLVNLVGIAFKFHIAINWVTALIAGFFGVPGIIFLIVFKLFL